MSVNELCIITDQKHVIKVIKKVDGEFEFEIFDDQPIWFWLNRSQAHMLMLWLQEHLK